MFTAVGFHLKSGFKKLLCSQMLVFTLILVSRRYCVHQFFLYDQHFGSRLHLRCEEPIMITGESSPPIAEEVNSIISPPHLFSHPSPLSKSFFFVNPLPSVNPLLCLLPLHLLLPSPMICHSISNRKFCCFSFIIAMVHQNSPTVEFLQEKSEHNLRRANTELSVDFRRANTEPSVDFRKANTELSVNFRRANTETY